MSLFTAGCGTTPKENPEAAKTVQPATTADTPVIDSVAPNSGSGKQQNFTVTASDEAGFTKLGELQLLINTTLNNKGACSLYRNTTGVYLFNDLGSVLEGPAKPNTTLKNSQCTVSESASSLSGSGKTRTATFAVTFSKSFTGSKHLYAYATSTSGRNTGFLDRGVWQSQ